MDNNNEELEFDSLPNKKKYGFRLNPIWIFVIAAVCVLGVVVGINFRKISNAIVKATSTPAEYFQHVQKEEVATAVSSVSKAYGNIIKGKADFSSFDFSNGIGIDYFFRATLGADGQDMLKSVSGIDFSWINSVDLLSYADYRNDNFQEGIKVNLNGTDIFNISGIATTLTSHENGDLYITVPELLTKSLKVPGAAFKAMIFESLEEAGVEIPEGQYNQETMQALYDSVSSIADAMPDEKTFEKLLTRYTNIVLKNLENAESETYERYVGEISETVTEVTVYLDQDSVSKIIKELCETAANDEDLKKSYLQVGEATINAAKAIGQASQQDVSDLDEVDLQAKYEEMKNGLLETAENSDEIAKAYVEAKNIKYIIFVTNEGRIAGRRIEVIETYEENTYTQTYEILSVVSGKQVGFSFSIYSDAKNTTETLYSHEALILSEATRLGSELTGTVKFIQKNNSEVEELYRFKYEELDVGSVLKGKLKGTLIFDVQKTVELLTGESGENGVKIPVNGASLVCKIDTDLLELKSVAEVSYKNSENADVLSISMGFVRNDTREIAVPEASNCVTLTDKDDLMSIYSVVSISKLIEELKTAGVPATYTAPLESVELWINIMLPEIVESIIEEIEDRLYY